MFLPSVTVIVAPTSGVHEPPAWARSQTFPVMLPTLGVSVSCTVPAGWSPSSTTGTVCDWYPAKVNVRVYEPGVGRPAITNEPTEPVVSVVVDTGLVKPP